MKLSNKKLELIRPEILNTDDRIQAWFTCKNAGLNESSQHISGLNLGFNTNENKDIVKQHRKSLLSELDIKPQHIAYAEQVHGSKVKVVKKGDTYDGVDALITQTPGLTLAIQVAD
ncbi:MAG: laccase domain-containing protein, partial [Candidatus Cyclobacteriaceae bacterium M2_1C_046]